MCANQERKTILLVASISQQRVSESEIDATLQDGFPAGDPPSWTLGVEKAVTDAAFSQAVLK
jgi:hypothetical protein